LKKIKKFFFLYLHDFISFIFKARKNLGFFKKKTAKGVDDPKYMGYSLTSLLHVLRNTKNKSALFKN